MDLHSRNIAPKNLSSTATVARGRSRLRRLRQTLHLAPSESASRRTQLDMVPRSGGLYQVASDVLGLRTAIANVYLIGEPGSRHWVLVDAGVAGHAGLIRATAERRFGRGVAPSAIILTHGHFDHIGTLRDLLRTWDVPIYAHRLELPYLSGRSSYPPPDPSVGGGAMAWMSWMYPRRPIDLGTRVRTLPEDGHITQLPGWNWIPTPGHTPGHIALFRSEDRVLIAGDAFVTIRAESMLAYLAMETELHGPPMYFTPDWRAARESVQMLAALEPSVAATGHGIPLRGEAMREELSALARDFELRAVPSHGRYVSEPAVADETGVVHVPPRPVGSTVALALCGAAIGCAAGYLISRCRKDSASSE
jgi:glyoxylase-like metal-dependent hydrolase (beta-lactamase superfamily II)